MGAKKSKPTKAGAARDVKAPEGPALRPAPVRAATPGVLEGPDEHLKHVVVDSALLGQIVLFALACAFLWAVRGVLVPLLFVCVFTFIGAPSVARMQKRGMKRALASAIVVGSGVVIVLALLSLVLPPLVLDLTELFKKLPDVLTRATDFLERRLHVQIPTTFKELSGAATQELLDTLAPMAQGVAKGGATAVAGTVKTGAAVLSGAVAALGAVALVPILTFFLLAELPETIELARVLAPRRLRATFDHYGPLANAALAKLIRGQLIVAAIMALIYIVGLTIGRVPLALAIGILSGAAYVIPFASATVCFVLATVFSLMEHGADSVTRIVAALIVCVVVQIVETYVLTPKIVGEQAGLSPLAALLAVLLGGTAGGFLGVLFALPVGCVIALVLREEARRRRAILSGSA